MDDKRNTNVIIGAMFIGSLVTLLLVGACNAMRGGSRSSCRYEETSCESDDFYEPRGRVGVSDI